MIDVVCNTIAQQDGFPGTEYVVILLLHRYALKIAYESLLLVIIIIKYHIYIALISNKCSEALSYRNIYIDGQFFILFLFDKFKGNTLSQNVLKDLVPSMSLYP